MLAVTNTKDRSKRSHTINIDQENAFPPEQVQAFKELYKSFSKQVQKEIESSIKSHCSLNAKTSTKVLLGLSICAAALLIYKGISEGSIKKWSPLIDPALFGIVGTMFLWAIYAGKDSILNFKDVKRQHKYAPLSKESEALLKKMVTECSLIITVERLEGIAENRKFKALPKTDVEEHNLLQNDPELKAFLQYNQGDLYIFFNEILQHRLGEKKAIIKISAWDEDSNQNGSDPSKRCVNLLAFFKRNNNPANPTELSGQMSEP